jgi:hypothetical protein
MNDLIGDVQGARERREGAAENVGRVLFVRRRGDLLAAVLYSSV